MRDKQRIMRRLFDFARASIFATRRRRKLSNLGCTKLHQHPVGACGAIVTAALMLSGCIESQVPLLTDVHPLLGQSFEVNLYEDFVDGKANSYHSTIYRWEDGRYVRASGSARDLKHFVVQSMTTNDYLIQTTDRSEKIFNYWIGRKIIDGVYMIFALNEADVDEATRAAVCVKDLPTGVCQIQTFDQLAILARATAAKPVRNPALGVILAK
jgi:hypothetical protein